MWPRQWQGTFYRTFDYALSSGRLGLCLVGVWVPAQTLPCWDQVSQVFGSVPARTLHM